MTTPSAEFKLLKTAIEMLEDTFSRGGLSPEQIIELNTLKKDYDMVSLTSSFGNLGKLNTKKGGRTKRQRHRKKRRSTAQRY